MRSVRATWACVLVALAQASWAEGDAVIRAEPEIQPYPREVPVPKARRVDASLVRSVTLERAAPAVVEKMGTPNRMGTPLQVGFGREVPQLSDGVASASRLPWIALETGAKVAAFSVTSPDAAAIRVGLRVKAIPAKTLVRFYAPDGGPVHEVSAEELQENVGRNLAAGQLSQSALIYWSPVIEGATAVVEIELPAGSSPAHLDLAAPTLAHLVTSPGRNFELPAAKVAAGSCNNDVSCYLQAWSTESNAVARMLFQDEGSSWYCTGTLLVDLDTSTTIPYFLSANHCIDNQAAASSLQTYWFYRSASCNGTATNSSVAFLNGGASLLYNTATTDTSLMKLAAAPPGGAMYAGWSVGSTPGVGASVADLHHPQGDKQKISFGSINSYASCTAADSESFNCRETPASSSSFIEAVWNSGVTEPGSSGSGLFLTSGHYLIGQLYGGTTSCSKPVGSGADFFGRFDLAYRAALSTFLGGAPNSGSTGQPGGGSAPGPTGPALDYSAMWWNPSESGWGMSITQHGATMFAAWYIYDHTGTATWLVMPGGTWTSSTSITGDLFATSGPLSTQPFDPSQVNVQRVGTATIAFSAADRAVLSYVVNGVSGTKAIQQQNFGVVDGASTASYADLWWTSTESGWGLSVNQQYATLFSVVYAYDPSGNPMWYVMPGGTWSGSTYSGPLYQTSMPSFDFYSTAFDPSTVQVRSVGTMSIQFSGTQSATLTYTVNGQALVKAITREAF